MACDGVAYDGGSSLRVTHPGGAPSYHPTFQTDFAAEGTLHAAWKWCAEEGQGGGRVGVAVVLTSPGKGPFALMAAPGSAAALPTAVAGVPVEQTAEAASSAGSEEGRWRTATAVWTLPATAGPCRVAQVGVCAVGGACTLRVGWLAVGPEPTSAQPRPLAQLPTVRDLRTATAPTLYRAQNGGSSGSGGGVRLRCAVAWTAPDGCAHADVYAGDQWAARAHGGWAELDVAFERVSGAEGDGEGAGPMHLPVRVVCADEAAMPVASGLIDARVGGEGGQ